MESNDECGMMNDELKNYCLYFRVHRSSFRVSLHLSSLLF
ncbi:MAG: hypothetical protein QOJ02_3633 [Acidobacteriota bacterium]|jgi:hypothetical protein|nr:hypothetical protein [Acidobacteriota bacterium]